MAFGDPKLIWNSIQDCCDLCDIDENSPLPYGSMILVLLYTEKLFEGDGDLHAQPEVVAADLGILPFTDDL